MKTWGEIKTGILSDCDMEDLCPSKLITKNYDPSFVRQTCYELRVGEIMWNTYISEAESRKVSIKDNGGAYLPAKAYSTIITMEELELPTDCVGKIMTKGQLFSIGISAVNTSADPGFSGPLGITLINHSSKPIFLKIGEPIAKIEFEKLNTNVKHPYKGPHLKAGELWPIPDSYHNIPSVMANKEYPLELKDTLILALETRINSIGKQLINKIWTIKLLSIIIVLLTISSVHYWISNWASMSSIIKVAVVVTSSVMSFLVFLTNSANSLSRFIKLIGKKESSGEKSY